MKPGSVTVAVVFAALFAAIAWNYFTWHVGMPSSSHAVIGGLVAVVVVVAAVAALLGTIGWAMVHAMGARELAAEVLSTGLPAQPADAPSPVPAA